MKGFVLKKVINLNGDSRFTSPPSYSGWLGSCWFEEGKTEDRNRYIEQIKSEKFSKIKSNNLVLESVSGNLIKFSKVDGDTYTFYSFTFAGQRELEEILKRTNSRRTKNEQ